MPSLCLTKYIRFTLMKKGKGVATRNKSEITCDQHENLDANWIRTWKYKDPQD